MPLGYPISARQFPLGYLAEQIVGLDVPHLVISELLLPAISALLFTHISRIIGMSAKEQMGRIAASWVVALMAYQKTFRDIAKSKRVCDPMRSPDAFEFGLSVSKRMLSAKPRPALIRPASVNLAPKVSHGFLTG